MRARSLLVSATVSAVALAGVMLPAAPALAAKKKAYKVTASASASTVKTSHKVTIKGKVSPASRAKVKLQRLSSGKWKTIASKKLSKKSAYSFTTNVGTKATTVKYRVTKAKTATYKAGVSKTVSVKVVTWGTVKAWGDNANGELGRGNLGGADALTAGNVLGLTEVVSIDANDTGSAAYAVRYDGSVWSWGDNAQGQLGRGAIGVDSGTPGRVALTKVKAVAATGAGAIALRTDGTVWAWGDGENGLFGTAAADADTVTPRKIAGLSNIKAIAGSDRSAFALKSDGKVLAWGYNNLGNLGRGNNTGQHEPIAPVQGLPKITKIAASGDTAYAVGPLGQVWGWGYNEDGEVGNGSYDSPVTKAAQVSGLTGVTALATGYDTAFAIGTGGLLWAWGWNTDGASGTGSTEGNLPSAQRINLNGVKAVGGSYATGYAVLKDGTVRSWGRGGSGELGNGGIADKPTPVKVTGVTKAVAVTGASSTGYALIG